jgi:hypothetical protein
MRKIVALTSIVLIADFCGISLLMLMGSCGKSSNPIAEERKSVYVDSVWVKGPGQINTLQMDPIYFARTTEGNIHQSRSRIQVGDSFIYIYRKMK